MRQKPPLPDWKSHYEKLWKPMPTPATEPTERMTLPAFLAARQAVRAAAANFERVKPTCHSCSSFSMGTCEQFGDVPKDFQETPEACPSWTFDSIPF